jgi:hypothetical protein
MFSRAESWRAPFQGVSQSQVLWAWILYFAADLHPAEGLVTPDTRNLTPYIWSNKLEKKMIDKSTYGETFITARRIYVQVV